MCPPPDLEMTEVGLDGHLPLVRPLPHVAVLQDELPHLFRDDYVGAEEDEEVEEAEARGEHTLEEKFGEWQVCPRAPVPAPGGPSCVRKDFFGGLV